MSIVLFGGKGMLGSALEDIFSDREVFAYDRDDIDMLKEEFVYEVIYKHEPEIIINAAAYTDVDGAETNREEAFGVNEHAVRYIAHAAVEFGARILHYSTDYVFSGNREDGYVENDVPGPAVNTYGESKLGGERVLFELSDTVYLVRTAWLYGPRGSNFVNTILRAGSEEESLSVVNDQFGSPTFTYDLARATKELLDGRYEYGTYHLVNEGVASWFELAREAVTLAGLSVEITPTDSTAYARPAKRPSYSVLKNTRGPKLRGWQDALSDYIVNYTAYVK